MIVNMNEEKTFAPFVKHSDDYYTLCVKQGKIVRDPDESDDYIEYHLSREHDDIWRVDRADCAELCTDVYYGRIPHRHFFIDLMSNQEVPLPKGWDTWYEKEEEDIQEAVDFLTGKDYSNLPAVQSHWTMTPITSKEFIEKDYGSREFKVMKACLERFPERFSVCDWNNNEWGCLSGRDGFLLTTKNAYGEDVYVTSLALMFN